MLVGIDRRATFLCEVLMARIKHNYIDGMYISKGSEKKLGDEMTTKNKDMSGPFLT